MLRRLDSERFSTLCQYCKALVVASTEHYVVYERSSTGLLNPTINRTPSFPEYRPLSLLYVYHIGVQLALRPAFSLLHRAYPTKIVEISEFSTKSLKISGIIRSFETDRTTILVFHRFNIH